MVRLVATTKNGGPEEPAAPDLILDLIAETCEGAMKIRPEAVSAVQASMRLLETIGPLLAPTDFGAKAQDLRDNAEMVRIFGKFRRDLGRLRRSVLKRDVEAGVNANAPGAIAETGHGC